MWFEERSEVLGTARAMFETGLVTGTSGNVSMRIDSDNIGVPLMAITPAATKYDEMLVDDIVVTDFEVVPVEGEAIPSSESLLHVRIYEARPDVAAVVHTHSVYSSVLAVTGLDIPIILDEVVFKIGGSIRVSKYGFPGSDLLARNVSEALEDRKAAIIANHGAVGVGDNLDEALEICLFVERVAKIFVLAMSVGNVTEIPREAAEAEKAIYRMRNTDIRTN